MTAVFNFRIIFSKHERSLFFYVAVLVGNMSARTDGAVNIRANMLRYLRQGERALRADLQTAAWTRRTYRRTCQRKRTSQTPESAWRPCCRDARASFRYHEVWTPTTKLCILFWLGLRDFLSFFFRKKGCKRNTSYIAISGMKDRISCEYVVNVISVCAISISQKDVWGVIIGG